MSKPSLEGVVKAMRRGGWSARGLIVDIRHGQIFETQVGPRQFLLEQAARDWLREVAATHAIKAPRIVVGEAHR